MAVRDKAPLLEASRYMESSRAEFVKRKTEKESQLLKETEEMRKKLYEAQDTRVENARSYREFREAVKTEFLTKAIKGIYLGALNERTVLDEHVTTIADNMVRGYIKENGGATAVLNSFAGKTYLLDRIRYIVEEETEEVMDDVDKDEPETQTVPEEKSEEMYDKLEKEDDVHSAIDIISQRISNAEEEFIRQNAEDKKKMEELANKVNERLQAVKDDRDMEEEDKEEAEQESAVMFSRGKSKIMNDRKRTVLEQMVLNLYSSIMKNTSLKENYTDQDSGQIDTSSIVEAATTMYGFLETVNTLQMDNVNVTYIQKVLDEMN